MMTDNNLKATSCRARQKVVENSILGNEFGIYYLRDTVLDKVTSFPRHLIPVVIPVHEQTGIEVSAVSPTLASFGSIVCMRI